MERLRRPFLRCVCLSIDEIRTIREESSTLLEVTLQKLESVIDSKLSGQEARLMIEIIALQKSTEMFEPRDRDRAADDGEVSATVQEAKRRRRSANVETRGVGVERGARDRASSLQQEVEESHIVVFSGFPTNSRK